MERCWRANAKARPPTPPPAIATVAFVVGGCGAPATMPRPAHVSQRLRGAGPPFRRRLRDLVYMVPTLPHASQARQPSTAAAPVALRPAALGCCRHRSRAPLDRRNGVTRRTNNSIISIVYGIAGWSALITWQSALRRCQQVRLSFCLASVRTSRFRTVGIVCGLFTTCSSALATAAQR